MKINEIYTQLDNIGCLTFTTIKDTYPISRIAHFFTFDELGLYFRTMTVKPFYSQLIESKKIAICGMSASTKVSKNDNAMPIFNSGYTIRLTGDTEQVSFEYVKEKALTDAGFALALKDIEKYPAMTTFRISAFTGEIYDYDFECEHREHKLIRELFTFGKTNDYKYGISINDNCIQCGRCYKKCSFKAIQFNSGKYCIDSSKCDACGDCFIACKSNAITIIN